MLPHMKFFQALKILPKLCMVLTLCGVVLCSSRYKLQETLEDLTTLSGPLISRFDILLTLRDTRDPQWDDVVSDHVLAMHQLHGSGQQEQVIHPKNEGFRVLRSPSDGRHAL